MPKGTSTASEIALAMSDDISSEASSINCRLDVSGRLISIFSSPRPLDDSMKLDRGFLEENLRPHGTNKIRSVGIATKAFKGTLG